MTHALRGLVDGQGAFVHRLCLLEISLRAEQLGEVVEVGGNLRVIRPKHRLDHLQRALIKRLRVG